MARMMMMKMMVVIVLLPLLRQLKLKCHVQRGQCAVMPCGAGVCTWGAAGGGGGDDDVDVAWCCCAAVWMCGCDTVLCVNSLFCVAHIYMQARN